MSHSQTSTLYSILAAHFVLAIAPIGTAYVPFDTRTLPIIWGLSSIPFSQVMLLSTWLGMTSGNLIRKLATAALAISFLTIWLALSQLLMFPEPSLSAIIPEYLKYTAIMMIFLAVLSLALAGASRVVGMIRLLTEADSILPDPRIKYSLFSLLAVTTATALILGLVRASKNSGADGLMIAQYLLAIVVFTINILATIWATLGASHVMQRLFAVFLVSAILGLSMAIGAGNSLETGPWWLLVAQSLIVVVPTIIVAITLLVIRTLGYRLLPSQSAQ